MSARLLSCDQESARPLYVKHQSFANVWSNLATNIEEETERAVKKLVEQLSRLGFEYRKVAQKAIEALSANSSMGSHFRITPFIADELSRLEDDQVAVYIIHRYRYDVYPQEKILDDYPPYLQIEPTSICNYRCVFCYQVDESFSKVSSGFMGSMDFALFKEIVDQITGEIHFLSLASRGEPLICKEIDRMLQYCSGKFLGLKLNTNASLLNEKRCHAILSGGVNTLVFSADAAAEPLYSRLRVHGHLETVLRHIELFQSIRSKHYSRSKIITRVSGVKVQPEQTLSSMIEKWSSLVDQIAFVQYNPWENVYGAPLNQLADPCSDLWRRMFVWYDGTINPCDTDYKSTLSVGSIQGNRVSRIWRSEPYERLRRLHLEKQRSSLNPCKRCVVV